MKLDDVIQQPGRLERNQLDATLAKTCVSLPCKIVKYDSTQRTVDVQPLVREVGVQEDPPLLMGVPVWFPGSFTYDISVGDECLVVFADRSIDAWWQSGKVSNPVSARRHNLSDGFAFVGIRSLQNVSEGTNLNEKLVEMTGATATVDGSSGFVPLPHAGDNNKYLKGDGTWGTVEASGGDVVGPASAVSGRIATFDGATGKLIKDSGYTIEKSVPSDAVFTDTTYSAGSGLALSGTTFRVDVPRVAESANHLPSINSFQLREYTNGTNYNLPSNAWYHIYEAKGTDPAYGTQLALGMTTDAAYYRKYSGSSWGSWKSLINTDHYDWSDITNKPSDYPGGCTGNAATATKLSGNASNTSASFWRGDNAWSSTLTGVLTLYREGTTAQDYPAGISLSNKDTTTGKTYNGAYVYAYQDHGSTPYGQNLVINSGGNTVIGAGESAGSLYSAKLVGNTSENMYVLADGTTYVYANANTVANRIGFAVNTSGHILPQKAEAANNNAQNLGASDNKWANVYATTFNGALSGNATTATTASNFKSTNNAGWQTDQYGSIKHQRSTSTDYLRVMTSGSTEKVKIYYETGNIETAGNITISHATSADMSAGSANPKITFSEGGSQPVHLIYTDYDSYRAPAGLKVIGGASATPAWFEVEGEVYASKVHNAVWNDYAECRKVETIEPGRCVTETESGTMALTTERLQPGCKITSDTFGVCMGKTDEAKTPIAVAGRVLVYPFRDRKEYHLGDAVCSAPNGTVDVMTRDEIKEYPERIVGTVSEIPKYDVWHGGAQDGNNDIQVNGRIWVYVR